MKIYTEEQVKHTLQLMGLHIMINEFIKKAEPIELPSDEEIEKSYPYCFQFTDDHHFGNKDCFKEGAKWMKEQILKQNK